MNAFFFSFNCECLFGLLFCGYSLARWPWEKIKPGFSLSKLTVGHRGGEEESPEASPCFVTVGQLCVSETRVNRAVWSHKAALIKGVYLSLLPQFQTSSLLLLCPACLPGRLTGRANGLTQNRGQPTKRNKSEDAACITLPYTAISLCVRVCTSVEVQAGLEFTIAAAPCCL